ncbi:hypothetical protein BDF20DRAFT_399600 [Mycotypha africana]|uniref:uncharacterized protein n=1 Tax=Mycotypha africana TaxID=64632 RepID=UPI0023012615|nr:uncharacterized protein BDF20DRAFT_399600 [Mycotypha africana]KAI8984619.1 hypothetical protein BDF20DRAFT_399600 [Mycotypha africana]
MPAIRSDDTDLYLHSLHPLEIDHGVFVERHDTDIYSRGKKRTRRLSLSSDLSDQALLEERRYETEEIKRRYTLKRSKCNLTYPQSTSSWDHLLTQLDLQPDLLQLIHLCKVEEDRRREEETKMKIKELQVLHQLQFLQSRENVQAISDLSAEQVQRKLPPLVSLRK